MKAAGRRRKGWRVENELVKLHRAAGVPCLRVPLSGAQEGWPGDLIVSGQFRAESKARAGGKGFKTLERWLGQNHLLFLRRDRQPPLVLMPWWIYEHLLQAFRTTGIMIFDKQLPGGDEQ